MTLSFKLKGMEQLELFVFSAQMWANSIQGVNGLIKLLVLITKITKIVILGPNWWIVWFQIHEIVLFGVSANFDMYVSKISLKKFSEKSDLFETTKGSLKSMFRWRDISRTGNCLLADYYKEPCWQTTSSQSQNVCLASLHLCIRALLLGKNFQHWCQTGRR